MDIDTEDDDTDDIDGTNTDAAGTELQPSDANRLSSQSTVTYQSVMDAIRQVPDGRMKTQDMGASSTLSGSLVKNQNDSGRFGEIEVQRRLNLKLISGNIHRRLQSTSFQDLVRRIPQWHAQSRRSDDHQRHHRQGPVIAISHALL
jgi:hypothetical protein